MSRENSIYSIELFSCQVKLFSTLYISKPISVLCKPFIRFSLARNEQLGTKAVECIHELNPPTRETVSFHQLDITSVESIRRFADFLKKKHGGLDILINNAAIAFQVE